MDKSNVIDFMRHKENRDYPLFAPPLRAKLEHGMKGYTDRHVEAVASFEQIICAHLISSVRGWAWKLGERLGNRIADSVLGKE
jgi:hypothetical protein